MQIGHCKASYQGQILRAVVEDDDWLKDGDVQGSTDASARIVGPNDVGGGGHVDQWHAPNRTVVGAEGEAGGQAGVDGPGRDVARSGDGGHQREVGAGFAANQGQILRRVDHAGWHLVVHGDVEVGHG